MSLTREQILATKQRDRELVSVPEWGGDVWVSVMSGEERDAWEMQLIEDRDKALANMRAKLVWQCVTDENGVRIFSESDVPALGLHSWVALERVMEVARRLNALTAKDVETIKGNSEPSRTDEPSSG